MYIRAEEFAERHREDKNMTEPYYLDQFGWKSDDYYSLHRYLHRMLYYYNKRMDEIRKIDLNKTSKETRVLMYCIINYYHLDFLMDLDNLIELKNTKPLEEKLIIDGDTAEDEDIYKEMNVVF